MAPLRYHRSLALILVSCVLGLSSGIQPITKPVRLTLDSIHAQQPLQAASTSTNSAADERLVDLASLPSTSDSESYQQADALEFPESGTGAVTEVFKDQSLIRQSSSADDPDGVATEASVCLLKERSLFVCSSCDLVQNAIAKIADQRLTAEDCCTYDDLYAACLQKVARAQAGKSDINDTDTSDIVSDQDSLDSNGMVGERDIIGKGEKHDVTSTVDTSHTISATRPHQVAGRSSKHDVTSEVDSAGNIEQLAHQIRTKKKSGNPFLGKRSINEEQDEEEAEVMKSREIAAQSSEKRKQNPFLGKRIKSNEFDEEEKRSRGGNPFLGKRGGGNPFLGKRGGNPFLGKREEENSLEEKRGGNPFLGKRRGDQFFGKKHGVSYGGNQMIIKTAARRGKNPFLGKRREESAAEKRANPFLGKRANPFLGKRANPFLGKRGLNPFLGKRANPFLGKRKNPFLGKREE